MFDWQIVVLTGVGFIILKIIDVIITRYSSHTRTYKEQIDIETEVNRKIQKLEDRFESLKELVSEFVKRGR